MMKKFYKTLTKFRPLTPPIRKKFIYGEKLERKFKSSTFMKFTGPRKKSFKRKNKSRIKKVF
jgi:hypothetical protein